MRRSVVIDASRGVAPGPTGCVDHTGRRPAGRGISIVTPECLALQLGCDDGRPHHGLYLPHSHRRPIGSALVAGAGRCASHRRCWPWSWPPSSALLGWRGVDQAAQFYRVMEFKAHGLMLLDSGWYGGNFPLGYSVLSPADRSPDRHAGGVGGGRRRRHLGVRPGGAPSTSVAAPSAPGTSRSRPCCRWPSASCRSCRARRSGWPPSWPCSGAGGRWPCCSGSWRRCARPWPPPSWPWSAWRGPPTPRAGGAGSSRTAGVSLGLILALGPLFPGDGPVPVPLDRAWSSPSCCA